MKKTKRKHRNNLTAFLFLLPSLMGITVFYVIPYIICFVKSLYIGDRFVGLLNYIQLFQNGTFLLALKNTAVFMIIAIPLLMVISFLLALFLNSFEKISTFFKSSVFIPVVIPSASLVCVWQLLFDDYGAVNSMINHLGMDTVSFFGSDFSMVMLILIYIWKYCGFCTVLFMSGLANVSRSLYESAKIDGASYFTIVKKITIPMIMPTTFFVFLMEVIYSFKIFREVFVLFGDYPDEHVYFIQNFINNNYYNLNFSRLSAASIVMSLFIVLLLFIFYAVERKRSFTE